MESTPPALPPVPPPSPAQEQPAPKPLAKLCKVLIVLACLVAITSFVETLFMGVHSYAYRQFDERNDSIDCMTETVRWAFPCIKTEEEAQLFPHKKVKDHRSQQEKDFDETLAKLAEDDDFLVYVGIPSLLDILISSLALIVNLAGAILTVVFIYRIVHNARMADPANTYGKHASPTWAVVSCVVPIANLFVPCREVWRGWKALAAAKGVKASAWLMGLWWGTFLISDGLDQIEIKSSLKNIILSTDFSVVTGVFDVLFAITCILLFTRLYRDLKD